MRTFKCVDLFCGAGGLSEGFRQNGFEILLANDFDTWCEATYKLNHPETEFISGPIQNISAEQILISLKMKKGMWTVLLVAHHAKPLASIITKEECTMSVRVYSVNICDLWRACCRSTLL